MMLFDGCMQNLVLSVLQNHIPGFSCISSVEYQKIWEIRTSKGVETTRTTLVSVAKKLDPEGVLPRRKKVEDMLLFSPRTRLSMTY